MFKGQRAEGEGGVQRSADPSVHGAACPLWANVSRQRDEKTSPVSLPGRRVPSPHPAAAGASIGPLEPPSGRRLFFFICVDVSVFLSLPETRASVPGGQCAGPRAAFSAHPLCQSIDYCFTLKWRRIILSALKQHYVTNVIWDETFELLWNRLCYCNDVYSHFLLTC